MSDREKGRTIRGQRMFIQCKQQQASRGQRDTGQLAAYLANLQSSRTQAAMKVMITHPDDDHEWVARRMHLQGDAGQLRAHYGPDYDIDIVVSSDDDGVIRVPHHGKAAEGPPPPSAGGTILAYICRPDRLEAVLGDLERNFRKRAMRYGVVAARRWYWWQVTRSIGAFCFKLLQSAETIHELLRKLGL
jgi:hypothetical protein